MTLHSHSLAIHNNGLDPFPLGTQYAEDIALFGFETLVGLADLHPSQDAESAVAAMSSMDEESWKTCCSSPTLFAWLADAHDSGKPKWTELPEDLRSPQGAAPLNSAPHIALWTTPNERFLRRLQSIGRGSRRDHCYDANFLDSNTPQFAEHVRNLEAGMALVRKHTPGFYEDMMFVRAIALVDSGASFRGSSGVDFRGLCFYSPDATTWDPAKWAEELAHESTHYLVESLDLREPLLYGEDIFDERHPGPLRPDLRHHHGNFHALVVFGRLAVLFERLADAGITPLTLRSRRDDYVRRSRPAFDALNTPGRFSPLGQQIWEAIVMPMFRV